MNKEEVEKLLSEKLEDGEHVSPVLPEGVKNYLIDIDGTITEDVPNEEPERMATCEPFPDALKTLTAEATIAKYGMIQDWDVSLVKDMSSVFATEVLRKGFIGDLSKWNTSNVITMKQSKYQNILPLLILEKLTRMMKILN